MEKYFETDATGRRHHPISRSDREEQALSGDAVSSKISLLQTCSHLFEFAPNPATHEAGYGFKIAR